MCSAAARVRLPFHRDEVTLLPEQSLLDGRVIRPEWEADGRALVVEVAQPGRYRLELAMRPTVGAVGVGSGFDLAIPRLATSHLELTCRKAAPAIEALGAGAVRREKSPAASWPTWSSPSD